MGQKTVTRHEAPSRWANGQTTPHSINQPLNHSFDSLHPSSLTRPSKPGPRPEPDPGACVAPSIPISYTTHLACVSIAKCNVGAVLLLPIPTSPMVHGTRALRVVAPRSRAPLLRRASLPRPLGLYTTQYCLPCIRAYIHAHIRYSIPGQGCCLAIIVMIVVVMATSTHTHSQGWDFSTDYLRLVF